jgi:hypothetical protein
VKVRVYADKKDVGDSIAVREDGAVNVLFDQDREKWERLLAYCNSFEKSRYWTGVAKRDCGELLFELEMEVKS